MTTRRESIKLIGAATAASFIPLSQIDAPIKPKESVFSFCLNTSTIKGQGQGIVETIEITAKAGYDGIELGVNDIKSFINEGKSLKELRRVLQSNSLVVEGAIAYSNWMVDDPEQRQKGLVQMEDDMNIMAELDCKRIAAPPSGFVGSDIDYIKAGERFRRVIDLGRKTGVMPQLEIWGSSKVIHHLGQALFVAAAANDPDVLILPDVYHLFKGGSEFNGLKMINGSIIEMFHFNDYPGNIPREEQNDSHRIYPGDGVAPLKEIIIDLHKMGGIKVLSLELFNKAYWSQDALDVATIGLHKMRNLVKSSII